jgi:hypothetical protein
MKISLNSIWYTIISIFGVILILSALFLLFIAAYPFEGINIKCPIEVITKHVYPGEYVILNMEYDKKFDFPSIISVQLIVHYDKEIEDIVFLEPLFSSNLQSGKHKIRIGFPLPSRINLDTSTIKKVTASLKITNIHEMWGFRNIYKTVNSERFIIDMVKINN